MTVRNWLGLLLENQHKFTYVCAVVCSVHYLVGADPRLVDSKVHLDLVGSE